MSDWPDSGFGEPPHAYVPPPTRDRSERQARLRLIRSHRVGPATYLRLMSEHGSATAALDALPAVARAAGVEDYTPCPAEVVAAECRAARRMGARLLTLGDADYPTALAEIADAPPLLWARGQTALLARPMVAIVGTRNASALGARMARRLAEELGAAGVVVVSGMARGIDALVHDAAMNTGTIAVQAGGLDIVYPAENAPLAARLSVEGLSLSERPFGLHPRARDFPRRNRIVSGLVRGVVVVEAALRSGSLITARCALDQGREVMAVPGHPLDSRASGCNALLRDGATLVRSAEDVLEVIGAPAPRPAAQADLPLAEPDEPPAKHSPESGGVEAAILARLDATPIVEDSLTRDLGHSARDVSRALAILEMAGRVTRAAGGMVSRSG